MSQLGQSETSGRLRARSVLPPTTDMRRLRQHVGFVPTGDIRNESLGVGVLPVLDQTRLDSVPLEFMRKADTIATAFDLMRATDATAKVSSTETCLRRAFLDEKVLREAFDLRNRSNICTGADFRSFQSACNFAISDENDVGVKLGDRFKNCHTVAPQSVIA